MIKKLLLLLCLATPLFAQTENTNLVWTNYGLSNGTFGSIDDVILWNDSIYTLNYISPVAQHRWLGGTSWSANVTLTNWEERVDFLEGTPSHIHFVHNKVYNGMLYHMSIGYDFIALGVQTNRTGYSNLTTKSTTTSSAGSSVPSVSYAITQAAYVANAQEDTLYVYATQKGYGSDSTIYKIRLPLDNSTTTPSYTSSTNLLMNMQDIYYTGRRPLYAFKMDSSIYVFLGYGKRAYFYTDTLYIFKSDSIGENFSSLATIGFADGNYSCIQQEGTTIGDTIHYFFVSGGGQPGRMMSIKSDGTLETHTVPTSLDQYGGFVTSKKQMLISVNDNAVGDGNDSAKVYIKNLTSGTWTWKMGAEESASDYKVPRKFVELDGIVFGYDSPIEGPYSALDADAQMDGYLWTLSGFLIITSPQTNDSYTAEDIPITWIGDVDTTIAYYSTDSGSSWYYIDTLTNYSGTWLTADILAIPINGTVRLRLTSLDSTSMDDTGNFTYISLKSITILSPIDSTTTLDIGATVNIEVKAVLTDSISIFYSINDSVSWIPLSINISTPNIVDTITYAWILPNIYGTIYLLATENAVSDTADNYTRPINSIGTNIPSQPAICWYTIEDNPIEFLRYYDVSCGWASPALVQVTSTLKDDGTGFDFLYNSDCDFGAYTTNYNCVIANPLRTNNVWVISGVDTNETIIGDYYTIDDTLTYKLRRYYIGADSILYCDDLKNGIDSLEIANFGSYLTGWTAYPYNLILYNVQRSKIQNDTIAVDADVEALNDAIFNPLIILVGNGARGNLMLTVQGLLEPPDAAAVYDIARIFTSLNITRDYFRGIDPKARKKGR